MLRVKDMTTAFGAWRRRCCANTAGTIRSSSAKLGHAERNAVSAAYDFAEHLPERRKMMQACTDYLDGLKTSANVIPLFKRGISGVK